jgi:hypothetical protein
VRGPITGRELLGNQPVGGRIIGNAQQRLGDAHERDAFLIGQSELLQEGVQKRALVAPGTGSLHECHRHGHGAVARPACEFERVQQACHCLLLGQHPGFLQIGGHRKYP